MSDQDGHELDYQTIRQRIVKRFRKRVVFVVNALLWVLFMALAQDYNNIGPGRVHGEFNPVVGAIWFLGLVVHFIYAFDIWSRMIERSTQREMERLQRMGYRVAPPRGVQSDAAPQAIKLKRQQVARLSDDGEIVYDDEPARKTGRSRQNNGDGRA
jgi:hypothetical protein